MNADAPSGRAEARPVQAGDARSAGGPGAAVGPPTLTEVVDLAGLPDEPEPFENDDPDAAEPGRASTGAALPTDEQLIQRVLAELSRQIDVMLEYRLREILGPLLARAADTVVRDARSELASTLRDVVARAVAAELARHRQR